MSEIGSFYLVEELSRGICPRRRRSKEYWSIRTQQTVSAASPIYLYYEEGLKCRYQNYYINE